MDRSGIGRIDPVEKVDGKYELYGFKPDSGYDDPELIGSYDTHDEAEQKWQEVHGYTYEAGRIVTPDGFTIRKGTRMSIVTKKIKGRVLETDEDARTVTYVMTTGKKDKDEETVNPEGGDFSDYMKNPAVQFNHDTDDFPIGKMVSEPWNDEVGEGTKYPQAGGPRRTALLGKVFFSKENPKGDLAYRMAKEGTFTGASISFLPTGAVKRNDDGGNHYDSWELLEFSLCPVGSNPDAIRLSAMGRRKPVKKQIRHLAQRMLEDPEALVDFVHGLQVNSMTASQKYSSTPEKASQVAESILQGSPVEGLPAQVADELGGFVVPEEKSDSGDPYRVYTSQTNEHGAPTQYTLYVDDKPIARGYQSRKEAHEAANRKRRELGLPELDKDGNRIKREKSLGSIAAKIASSVAGAVVDLVKAGATKVTDAALNQIVEAHVVPEFVKVGDDRTGELAAREFKLMAGRAANGAIGAALGTAVAGPIGTIPGAVIGTIFNSLVHALAGPAEVHLISAAEAAGKSDDMSDILGPKSRSMKANSSDEIKVTVVYYSGDKQKNRVVDSYASAIRVTQRAMSDPNFDSEAGVKYYDASGQGMIDTGDGLAYESNPSEVALGWKQKDGGTRIPEDFVDEGDLRKPKTKEMDPSMGTWVKQMASEAVRIMRQVKLSDPKKVHERLSEAEDKIMSSIMIPTLTRIGLDSDDAWDIGRPVVYAALSSLKRGIPIDQVGKKFADALFAKLKRALEPKKPNKDDEDEEEETKMFQTKTKLLPLLRSKTIVYKGAKTTWNKMQVSERKEIVGAISDLISVEDFSHLQFEYLPKRVRHRITQYLDKQAGKPSVPQRDEDASDASYELEEEQRPLADLPKEEPEKPARRPKPGRAGRKEDEETTRYRPETAQEVAEEEDWAGQAREAERARRRRSIMSKTLIGNEGYEDGRAAYMGHRPYEIPEGSPEYKMYWKRGYNDAEIGTVDKGRRPSMSDYSPTLVNREEAVANATAMATREGVPYIVYSTMNVTPERDDSTGNVPVWWSESESTFNRRKPRYVESIRVTPSSEDPRDIAPPSYRMRPPAPPSGEWPRAMPQKGKRPSKSKRTRKYFIKGATAIVLKADGDVDEETQEYLSDRGLDDIEIAEEAPSSFDGEGELTFMDWARQELEESYHQQEESVLEDEEVEEPPTEEFTEEAPPEESEESEGEEGKSISKARRTIYAVEAREDEDSEPRRLLVVDGEATGDTLGIPDEVLQGIAEQPAEGSNSGWTWTGEDVHKENRDTKAIDRQTAADMLASGKPMPQATVQELGRAAGGKSMRKSPGKYSAKERVLVQGSGGRQYGVIEEELPNGFYRVKLDSGWIGPLSERVLSRKSIGGEVGVGPDGKFWIHIQDSSNPNGFSTYGPYETEEEASEVNKAGVFGVDPEKLGGRMTREGEKPVAVGGEIQGPRRPTGSESSALFGAKLPPRKPQKAQPSDNIDPEKACQMLRDDDGTLSDAQKGMFGAACANAAKSKLAANAVQRRQEELVEEGMAKGAALEKALRGVPKYLRASVRKTLARRKRNTEPVRKYDSYDIYDPETGKLIEQTPSMRRASDLAHKYGWNWGPTGYTSVTGKPAPEEENPTKPNISLPPGYDRSKPVTPRSGDGNTPKGLSSLRKLCKALEEEMSEHEFGPVKDTIEQALKVLRTARRKVYKDVDEVEDDTVEKRYCVRVGKKYVQRKAPNPDKASRAYAQGYKVGQDGTGTIHDNPYQGYWSGAWENGYLDGKEGQPSDLGDENEQSKAAPGSEADLGDSPNPFTIEEATEQAEKYGGEVEEMSIKRKRERPEDISPEEWAQMEEDATLHWIEDDDEQELKTNDPPYIEKMSDGYSVMDGEDKVAGPYDDKDDAVAEIKRRSWRKRSRIKRLSKANTNTIQDVIDFLKDAGEAADTPKRISAGMVHLAQALEQLVKPAAQDEIPEDDISDEEKQQLMDKVTELDDATSNVEDEAMNRSIGSFKRFSYN